MIPTTIIVTCICFFLAKSSKIVVSAEVDSGAVDIYLIIGQSNAAGRDTNFDAVLDAPDPNVLLFTDTNQIEVAFQPLNSYSTIKIEEAHQGVCLGLEFGKAMHSHTGNPTLLIVNARGSTTIESWKKLNNNNNNNSETGYFAEAVKRVKAAEALTNNKLKGILWHQGESDVRKDDYGAYFDSLVELISDFRNELGDDDIPFLCGQLYHKFLHETFNGVLTFLDDSFFSRLSNVDWVSADQLTTYDNIHFDAASTREFGLRYANTMIKYI